MQDGIATILTGIHTGDVDVTVTFRTDAPQPVDGQWEEIVEVSLHSTSGELRVRSLRADLDEELPELSFNGPGDYRLRVHARGRDTAVDLAPDDRTSYWGAQVRTLSARLETVARSGPVGAPCLLESFEIRARPCVAFPPRLAPSLATVRVRGGLIS